MLDLSAFEQILEMDDDDDRDFSKGIVFGFFEQAVTTFETMEKKMYVTCPHSNWMNLSNIATALRRTSPNSPPLDTS